MLKLFSVFAFSSFLAACSYNMQKGKAPSVDQTKLTSDEAITFELVKTQVLNSCLQCHQEGKKTVLVTLSQIQQKKSSIWHEVDSGAMPPAGSAALTACKKQLLQKWIDLGAPETSDVKLSEIPACAGQKPDTEPPLPVVETPILLMPLNFKSMKDRILGPKCLSCHAPGKEESDMPFDTYENVMLIERMWRPPGKESKIYGVVTDKEDPMPTKESGIPMLTADEVEFLRRWIDAGAPEK